MQVMKHLLLVADYEHKNNFVSRTRPKLYREWELDKTMDRYEVWEKNEANVRHLQLGRNG